MKRQEGASPSMPHGEVATVTAPGAALDEMSEPEKVAIDSAVPDGSVSTAGPEEASGMSSEPTESEHKEFAAHWDTLARVALEQSDPVSALEEGAVALAEALVQRDQEREAAASRTQDRHAVLQDAYKHARLHRVGELLDFGYSLEQASAIVNADEAEVRMRAEQSGRDGAEVIYHYAVLHGYQPRTQPESARPMHSRQDERPLRRPPTEIECLVMMSDADFAAATKGERWRKLLQ